MLKIDEHRVAPEMDAAGRARPRRHPGTAPYSASAGTTPSGSGAFSPW